MFVADAIVLEGDEEVTVDTGPFGTRVVIRSKGRNTLTIEMRGTAARAIAHRLADAFELAEESIAGERQAHKAMLETFVKDGVRPPLGHHGVSR